MKFGLCTPAVRHEALPSFPSVTPAECNPPRGHASLNCVRMLVRYVKQCGCYVYFLMCGFFACHHTCFNLYMCP